MERSSSSRRGHMVGAPVCWDGFGPIRLDLLELCTDDHIRADARSRGRSAGCFGQVWEDPKHLFVVTFQRAGMGNRPARQRRSMEDVVGPRADKARGSRPATLQAD